MQPFTRLSRLALVPLLAGLLAACGTIGTPRTAAPQVPSLELDPTGSFATGYVIVGYHEGQDPGAVAAALGARVETDWTPIRAALLALPEGLSVAKAESLLKAANLRYVERRRMIERPPVPGTGMGAAGAADLEAQQDVADPDFGLQWMHRQMNTRAAWDAGYTGAGVRIGIHDDFVDHRHPDLVDNVFYPGLDAFTGQPITADTLHDGASYHGTAVAGTAAASANAIGGRGVAPGASIVPISIVNPSSGVLDTAAIVNGGIFAALGPDFASVPYSGTDTDNAPGGLGYVHVLNTSWGGNGYSQLIKDLMDFILLHDIVLVTSAGNTPTQSIASPAWYPGMISVAATTPQGHRATFSNRGLHIDVAAPGEAIWTTTTRACVLATPDASECDASEADYMYINGTSFSSPAVAGVAALIIEALADRDGGGAMTATPTPAQVRRILTSTAQPPEGGGYSEDLGHGIVDAGAAVARAENLTLATAPDGASLAVDVVLADDPSMYLASVGVSLVPIGHDAPTKHAQTADGSFLAEGQALFLGVLPGDYAVVVSGPHAATTGAVPGTASEVVTLHEGTFVSLEVALDVDIFDDPSEPNESIGNARPVQMGTSVRASFYNPDTGTDEDFFEIAVTAGSTYWLNFETASGSFDAAMQVLDGDGNVLAENDDYRQTAGGTALPDPALAFTPDTTEPVYIRLFADGDSRYFVYDLDVTELVGSEAEPNGSGTPSEGDITAPDFAGADPLGPGQAVTAEIATSGDVDIFEVSLDPGTWVVDLETAVNLNPDTVLVVFDGAGTIIAQNDDYDEQDSRAEFAVAEGATYYLAVSDFVSATQSSTGPYTLSIAEVVE